MSWATRHIADLQAGRTVVFRPHGNSMQGRVESGQLCTVVTTEAWGDPEWTRAIALVEEAVKKARPLKENP